MFSDEVFYIYIRMSIYNGDFDPFLVLIFLWSSKNLSPLSNTILEFSLYSNDF